MRSVFKVLYVLVCAFLVLFLNALLFLLNPPGLRGSHMAAVLYIAIVCIGVVAWAVANASLIAGMVWLYEEIFN